MSGGILGALQVGKDALQAQQAALFVTGNNISNASRPGYSRQEVLFGEGTQSIIGAGIRLRVGVSVSDVRRVADRFLDQQIVSRKQALGQASGQSPFLDRLEIIFNEIDREGLNASLDDFFASLQDLTHTPTARAQREGVIVQGQALVNQIATTAGEMDRLLTDLDRSIQSLITEVNGLAQQIAQVNADIGRNRTGGEAATAHLFDQRQELLKELADRVGFGQFEDQQGLVTVNVANRAALVLGIFNNSLVGVGDTTNNGFVDVNFKDANGVQTDLTPFLSGGQIGGLLQLRDTFVRNLRTDLNTLTLELIEQVNRVHASGTGLQLHSSLTGTNAVADPAAAALNNTTASNLPFAVQNGSFNIIVRNSGVSPATATTYTVNVLGTDTLNTLVTKINTAVAGGQVTASVSGGALRLVATASNFTFTFANDTSDTLLALGVNTFFNGRNATTIAVNPLVGNNPDFLAAAQGLQQGDNRNAAALAALQTTPTLSGNSATLNEFYRFMVRQVGNQVASNNDAVEQERLLDEQLQVRREEVSGVSLDEEATQLMRFQRAFEAASRFIVALDEMLEVLVNLT